MANKMIPKICGSFMIPIATECACITYDLSIDGDTIILTGSDGSTSQVTLPDNGAFNIKFEKDSTTGLYKCDKSFEDIKNAIAESKDINILFPNEDGTISYDKWYINATDNLDTITFASGHYENNELNERCWIEQSISFDSDYAKGDASLELIEKIVYSRDYKIRYACGTLPDGAATPVGTFPVPRYATEVPEESGDHAGEYYGTFEIVEDDLVAPSVTVAGLAFKYWSYDKDGTEPCEVGDSVTKDVRLYAQYGADIVSYTVQFRATGPDASLDPYDLARTSNSGEVVSFDCRTPGNPMGSELLEAGEVMWGVTIMTEGLDGSGRRQKPLKVNGSEISGFTYTPEDGDVITVEGYFYVD